MREYIFGYKVIYFLRLARISASQAKARSPIQIGVSRT
jgi:hypothetical protein